MSILKQKGNLIFCSFSDLFEIPLSDVKVCDSDCDVWCFFYGGCPACMWEKSSSSFCIVRQSLLVENVNTYV